MFKVWLLIKLVVHELVSQVESFLCPDKQGTPEKGWRIQQAKRCVSTNNNKDEDSPKKSQPKLMQIEPHLKISERQYKLVVHKF